MHFLDRNFYPYFWVILGLILASTQTISAQSGGQSMFGQMRGELDPITMSMGGFAPVWGPSGLGSMMDNPSLLDNAAIHPWFTAWSSRPAGLQQGGFAMMLPLKRLPDWHAALGTQFTGTESMPATDPFGLEYGQIRAGEAALLLNIGHRFNPRLNWGIQTRVVSSYLGSYSAWGAGINMGLRYTDTAQRLGICLLLQDASFILKDYVHTAAASRFPPIRLHAILTNELKYLPLRWSVGMQHLQNWSLRYDDPSDPFKANNLLIGQDSATKSSFLADLGKEVFVHLVFNAEIRVNKAIRLRGGYNALQRTEWAFPERSGSSGFTFGAGIVTPRFRVDFGTGAQTLAGRQSSLAFSWNFNSMKP